MPRMSIRLAQGNVAPSKLDDYVAFIRSALPIEKEQLGYWNAYQGVDRAKSRSMIV